jgi:hypothetical protein
MECEHRHDKPANQKKDRLFVDICLLDNIPAEAIYVFTVTTKNWLRKPNARNFDIFEMDKSN